MTNLTQGKAGPLPNSKVRELSLHFQVSSEKIATSVRSRGMLDGLIASIGAAHDRRLPSTALETGLHRQRGQEPTRWAQAALVASTQSADGVPMLYIASNQIILVRFGSGARHARLFSIARCTEYCFKGRSAKRAPRKMFPRLATPSLLLSCRSRPKPGHVWRQRTRSSAREIWKRPKRKWIGLCKSTRHAAPHFRYGLSSLRRVPSKRSR